MNKKAINNETNFEDFIFSKQLRSELKHLLDNPDKLPSALCFYGSPGNGKTTFAKYLASSIAKQVQHYDSNGFKTSNAILRTINKTSTSVPLDQFFAGNEYLSERLFSRVFIIDEFHDSSFKAQDAYKITIEDMHKRRSMFIFILNTDPNNTSATYESRVTPAMRSRFYAINFDIQKDQIDEVSKIAKKKYPQMPIDTIRQLVSSNDIRKLSIRANMIN